MSDMLPLIAPEDNAAIAALDARIADLDRLHRDASQKHANTPDDIARRAFELLVDQETGATTRDAIADRQQREEHLRRHAGFAAMNSEGQAMIHRELQK